MIDIKGFADLSKTLKGLVLGVACNGLIWYWDIYLFAPTFFKSAPNNMAIILALVITTGWFLTNTVLMTFLRNNPLKPEQRVSDEFLLIFGGTYGMAILLVFSYIEYWMRFRFFCFVNYAFILEFVIVGFRIIVQGNALNRADREKKDKERGNYPKP